MLAKPVPASYDYAVIGSGIGLLVIWAEALLAARTATSEVEASKIRARMGQPSDGPLAGGLIANP